MTLHEVRSAPPGASLGERATNPLLLAPVVGAFLAMLWTRSVPSLAWPVLLLAAALVTRLLKAYPVDRDRAAILGTDGVLLANRFVPVAELAAVERERHIVWITTRGGERLGLRGDAAAIRRAAPVAQALRNAIASARGRDTVAERLVEELGATGLHKNAPDAYRGLGFDAARCLTVVEDAAAAPRARIAAAELLARDPDVAVRARIAEAAQATANPELRDALLGRADSRRRASRGRS